MNYQEIVDMAKAAIVTFVHEKYGETIEPNNVNILFNQSAFTICKIIAIDTTPVDRIYVVTYDKNVGTPSVMCYVPET